MSAIQRFNHSRSFDQHRGATMNPYTRNLWEAVLAGAVLTTSFAASAIPCASLTGRVFGDATVTSAVQVAATSTVPTYCLVEAHARPTSDSDIKILVGLPTAGNWNGKFLQSGNGGFAGSVAPPTGSVQLGYVGAATDDGHTASGFDASWALGHPEKVVDFGYRALKETTDTAKALIAAFYGASPRLSYFSGCSDGGREALQEAQRYPGDWDGIVVGAPANFWTHHFTG
ncbi:MAG: tannase/feruloyl esterase family alpha/beta hydrolase [Myxococcales bacterium]|nr:tannase/feruloyl esterase family alpha/beta hydrolase [Myxococcales bacterium]